MTALQKAQQAIAAKLAAGEKIVKKNPIEKSRDNPRSLRLAINAKCYDCIGQDADPNWRNSIRECTCYDCPLYNVRKYKK